MRISETYLDTTNKQIVDIVNNLNDAFSARTIHRAIFSEDSNGFKATIRDFKSIDLINISKILCSNLHQQLLNLTSAKGGYLVFTLYSKSNYNYLGVFFVRKTSGANLEFQDPNNSWEVELVRYLDVKHFAMGARINLTNLLDKNDSRYLQLAKGNTKISDYFTNWIGVTNPISEDIDAKNLFEIINDIDLEEEEDRDEVKRKIYNYAKDQPNRLINIRSLSDYVFGDSEKIINYCEDEGIEISHEFKLRGNALNKFYKITAEGDGIKLQANYDKFNAQDIQVLNDNETIIIKSKKLVTSINKQKYGGDEDDE